MPQKYALKAHLWVGMRGEFLQQGRKTARDFQRTRLHSMLKLSDLVHKRWENALCSAVCSTVLSRIRSPKECCCQHKMKIYAEMSVSVFHLPDSTQEDRSSLNFCARLLFFVNDCR